VSDQRIRVFELIRQGDESGVSGVGKVGEGVVFSDGSTCFRWLTPVARSTVFSTSFGDFLRIHVESHPGNETVIRWLTAAMAIKSKA
jgi:hypothetical protein